eukprot:7838314-Heterocapsa_arctica.AAC.1
MVLAGKQCEKTKRLVSLSIESLCMSWTVRAAVGNSSATQAERSSGTIASRVVGCEARHRVTT